MKDDFDAGLLRIPAWMGRVLPVLAAAGLTGALWWGAAAESDRHRQDAIGTAAARPVHITLPTVVVVGHRKELRDQVVAGLSDDCRPIPAPAGTQGMLR